VLKVNVKLDIQQARRMFKGMHRKVEKAAARAINRAADSTATASSREIASLTKIKQREVKAKIKVSGATAQRLIAVLTAYPYSPNLKNFRATQNKHGVAASAWEKRKTYKRAVIHPRTGSVVTRTTTKRFPLKGLRGPSVPSTFLRKRVVSLMGETALKVFQQRFAHELKRLAA
jgi:hypothetical protein